MPIHVFRQKIYEHPIDPALNFKAHIPGVPTLYASAADPSNSAALDLAPQTQGHPRIGADYKAPKPTKKRMPTPRSSLDWMSTATLEKLESRFDSMSTITRTAPRERPKPDNVYLRPRPQPRVVGGFGEADGDRAVPRRPASAALYPSGELEVIGVGDLVQYAGIAGDRWQARVLAVEVNHRFTLVQVKDGADMPWRCSAHRAEITPFPRARQRTASLRGGAVPTPAPTAEKRPMTGSKLHRKERHNAVVPGLYESDRGSEYLYQPGKDERSARVDHGTNQPWTDL